jgi:hypothetical protein
MFALGILFGGIYLFFQIVGKYIELFPEGIGRTSALSLLGAIIQVDGILLGFFGLVYASVLAGLQSQSVTVIGELLKSLHLAGLLGAEHIKKRLRTPNTAEYEFQRLLDQIEPMRKSALQWLGITSLLLIASILWSFSRMANTSPTLSRGDLYWSVTPLFVAVVTFLWGISQVRSVKFE